MGVGGKCHFPAALPPGVLIPTVQEAGLAQGPIWIGVKNSNSPAPPGFKTWAIQPLVSRYTHYVILAPLFISILCYTCNLLFCWSGLSLLKNLGTIMHFHKDQDIWMLLFNIIIVISSKAMWKVIYKNINFCNEIRPVKMGLAMELHFIRNNKRYLQGLMYNYWDYGHIVKFKISNFYIPVSQFPYLMSQCK
jgi:hypothetical protein